MSKGIKKIRDEATVGKKKETQLGQALPLQHTRHSSSNIGRESPYSAFFSSKKPTPLEAISAKSQRLLRVDSIILFTFS